MRCAGSFHRMPSSRTPSLALSAVLAAASLPAQTPSLDSWESADTTTYYNEATAVTVTHARARHYYRDSVIHDYSATVRTRLDAGLGKRRFARIPRFMARETMARVQWEAPDDLRIEYLGARFASTLEEVEADVVFDRPWFIPRAVGDSIALLGGGFPEYPALHPLAEQGPEYYRYALHDSVTLNAPNRTVRALAIRVVPRTTGHSLIAGDIWVDASTHEVVRMTFVFVGTRLWVDPEDPDFDQREADVANKILSAEADLEYGLFENEYWLPYRQYIGLQVEIPWIIDVQIPIRFITEFSEHEVNRNPPMAWAISWDEINQESSPDSVAATESTQSIVRRHWEKTDIERCVDCASQEGYDPDSQTVAVSGFSDGGGRWEIVTPPVSDLREYAWQDDLRLNLSPDDDRRLNQTIADLANLEERLPPALTGRFEHGVAWRELADMMRFNRVQGLSLGAGYRWRPGAMRFTEVFADVRFGLGDLRPTATASLERESPVGFWALSAFADVAEQDPLSRGQSIGNSLNALFTGHDDADYFRRFGASLTRGFYRGPFVNSIASLSIEHHQSMSTTAGSAFRGIYDVSTLAPNPPVREGDYARAALTWRAPFRSRVRLDLNADFLLDVGGGFADPVHNARAWAVARAPFSLAERSGALTGFVGGSVGDEITQQLFRVGGSQTVRSHTYGRRVGDGAWAVRLDWSLAQGSAFVPVLFFDAGDTFDSAASSPMFGGGIGLSLFNGWFRTNLAYGLEPDDGLKFDLLFGAPR